jgi:hypothetical protein
MPPIASHSSAQTRQVSAQAWQASMHSWTSFVAVISYLLDHAFCANPMKMMKPPHAGCKSSLSRRPIHAVPSEGKPIEGKIGGMSTVEVFTGSCRLCDAAVEVVNEAVTPCGCEVIVRSIDGPEAKAYGLTSVPSVVKNGEVVFTR